jgi:hypothetical protein
LFLLELSQGPKGFLTTLLQISINIYAKRIHRQITHLASNLG